MLAPLLCLKLSLWLHLLSDTGQTRLQLLHEHLLLVRGHVVEHPILHLGQEVLLKHWILLKGCEIDRRRTLHLHAPILSTYR